MRPRQIPCPLMLTACGEAVEGMREINETRAVQTGCFAGARPDYPVIVAQLGQGRAADMTCP